MPRRHRRLSESSGSVVPSLFDAAPSIEVGGMVRSSDPETSRDAAEQVKPSNAATRALVESNLERAGRMGLTDFELEARTRIKQTSIGKRRGELRDAGVVVPKIGPDGRPVKRRTQSGSLAQVWVLASYAQQSAVAS